MKNKKLIIFLIAMAALLCAAGGTYAYYTTNIVTHNVISSGRVDVELIELADDGSNFKNIEGALPGETYAKVVQAKNTGESDAWVRMKLVKTVKPAKAAAAALNAELVKLNIHGGKWVEKDGWYYYDSPLKPEAVTPALLGAVTLDLTMGNEWQEAQLLIDVYLEAVQVANNGSTVFEAAGWPDKY